MFTIIFAAVFVLFSNEGEALQAERICCEEIESLLQNKTNAYKTVCLGPKSELSSNCCRNIETEVEKYRFAYKALCLAAEKPVATPLTTTTMTATTTAMTTERPIIKCKTALGVESGNISNIAMMSSTILNASSLPHFGRLRKQLGRCAWIPATSADRNSSWLQVDLGTLTNVSAVATQGSCSGDQWTKSYVIKYSENGVDWKHYGELGTIRVFTGNNDSSSVVKNYIKSPFEARFVRISPTNWHKNPALRIELFTDSCNPLSVPALQSPRSCLDHFKNGLKTNGYYNIYDASSNLITVYCDMTSEPRKAWTLVTSWATSNKDMAEFQSTPLSQDSPVDESSPNWNRYRMSLSMMNDLSAQSTHWRATCNFPTHGLDYTDYVRGKFVDFDVITFHGHNVCKRVEYVNIRGHKCSDCNLPWWQNDGQYCLHTDSTYTTCGFDPTQGAGGSEDNFGAYRTSNANFRCTADASTTTNWWFGGNTS